MKAAVIQSSYIPWKGYFDFIHEVDTFIFLDDVEYSKGGWRNRNKIKESDGTRWLTVPVQKKGLNSSTIDRVRITDSSWQAEHLHLIETSYKQAPFFDHYRDFLEELYTRETWYHLSQMNQCMTKQIARELGITNTEFFDARTLDVQGRKDERVIALLQKVGADIYLSGPSARDWPHPRELYIVKC